MVLNFIDFDDTLAFTNDALYEAYNASFQQVTGISITPDIWYNFKGRSYKKIAEYFGIYDKHSQDEIHKRKYEIYHEYYNKITINNMILNKIMDNSNTINVIVSNTSRDTILSILDFLHFPMKLINTIKTTKYEDLKKPHPYLYFLAFEDFKFKSDIDKLQIFEDSENGIMSASRALKLIKPNLIYSISSILLYKVNPDYIYPIESSNMNC